MCYQNYKSGLKSGMRVRVIRQHKYKTIKLVGKVGTVKYGDGIEVTVDIDDIKNPYAGSGHFYFKPSELEVIGNCDNNMEENVDMSNTPMITNYVNAVKIQYLDRNTPNNCVYANFISNIKVGDMCVIKSAHHGFGLAIVVEVIDRNDFEISSREVVTIVDTRDYDERVATRKKATELLATMQERAKKLQDIALYQMLAENDPEMAELLKEYKGLTLV